MMCPKILGCEKCCAHKMLCPQNFVFKTCMSKKILSEKEFKNYFGPKIFWEKKIGSKNLWVKKN